MLRQFTKPQFLSGVVIGLVLLVVALMAFNERGGATDRVLDALGLPTIGDSSGREGGGGEGDFEFPAWPWEENPAPDKPRSDAGGAHGAGPADDRLPDPAAASIDKDDLDALTLMRTDVTERQVKEGGYNRDAQFGGWKDPDGNGCDSRNDVLARDLEDTTVDSDGCTVLTGTFQDPYTGATIDFERGPKTSSAVQIDHVIALGNAYELGASDWSQERRVAFANDPANLIASDGPANGSKGAKGANEWMPANTAYHCAYAQAQIHVKSTYDLPVGPQEYRELASALKTC